jgi:hypothetical protein
MSVFLEPCLKALYMSGYHKTKCMNNIEHVFESSVLKYFVYISSEKEDKHFNKFFTQR